MPSSDTIQFYATTDVGRVRDHNEDNFLVADLTRRAVTQREP